MKLPVDAEHLKAPTVELIYLRCLLHNSLLYTYKQREMTLCAPVLRECLKLEISQYCDMKLPQQEVLFFKLQLQSLSS